MAVIKQLHHHHRHHHQHNYFNSISQEQKLFFCYLNEAGQGTCFGRIVCELSDDEPFLPKCSLERLHIVHRVACIRIYRNHTNTDEVRVTVKESVCVFVCVCVRVCVNEKDM